MDRLPVKEQQRLSLKGRDLLLSRDYEGAEKFLRGLLAEWPDEPLGYFGIMAYYQVRNLDNFDFRFDPPYKEWDRKGKKLALKVVRDPEADPWDLLLAGGTLGVEGFYRAHNSHWFSGLRDGLNAVHAMRESFEREPKMTENLLGIGLYDYWRSHFTRKLRFLPFFPDRRKGAREKLARVIDTSEFGSVLAEISLAFIDFQEKRYEAVLEATEKLLKRYPRNTILRMLRGEAFLRIKKYPGAADEFKKILSIDPTLTKARRLLDLALEKTERVE